MHGQYYIPYWDTGCKLLYLGIFTVDRNVGKKNPSVRSVFCNRHYCIIFKGLKNQCRNQDGNIVHAGKLKMLKTTAVNWSHIGSNVQYNFNPAQHREVLANSTRRLMIRSSIFPHPILLLTSIFETSLAAAPHQARLCKMGTGVFPIGSSCTSLKSISNPIYLTYSLRKYVGSENPYCPKFIGQWFIDP